jgi:hypothetical protein
MRRHRADLQSPTRAPAKAGIWMAYAQIARSHHTDRGPGGHDSEEEGARACVMWIYSKQRLKMVRTPAEE